MSSMQTNKYPGRIFIFFSYITYLVIERECKNEISKIVVQYIDLKVAYTELT